jgi:hypothetical protein
MSPEETHRFIDELMEETPPARHVGSANDG